MFAILRTATIRKAWIYTLALPDPDPTKPQTIILANALDLASGRHRDLEARLTASNGHLTQLITLQHAVRNWPLADLIDWLEKAEAL